MEIWQSREEGDREQGRNRKFQLPITHYQCPMPHAPCPMPI
ncbi:MULTISPECIES: histidine kinase [unclassified Tolypothrix]|nr:MULTISPECIES: histidine kinase [unclassified Tolypothrix]EKF01234.1 hypothetical protein FDUTEX481_08115 [Tolypothrix sp. PCC 7601]UYD33012.1 histidine kinase [Tolypothrix sp. PCC 7601]